MTTFWKGLIEKAVNHKYLSIFLYQNKFSYVSKQISREANKKN